jgi:TolB-like protein/DNA-binding winged helix-turn-helix (wHTH) protein/tetratricopeptide (TPR) repeat protein
MKEPIAAYQFGQFILDTRDRRLIREGHEIYLRPKTYDTLLFLLERHGHLVTKNELLDAVWADVEVTENALTRCIKEVRAALGDEVQSPQFLRTIPRLGYEFIGNVEGAAGADEDVVEEEIRAVRLVTTEEETGAHTAEPAPAWPPVSGPAPRALLVNTPRSTLRAALPWMAALLLVAFVAGLVLDVAGLRGRLLGRAASPHIGSLAVLPLQNLSGDPQQEYFADGMTDELITCLGEIAALRVISRTSVMRYKQANKPLPQIAKDLNVDAVVEGSVLRGGDRVRISVRLIQASTDRRLWGHSYERDLRDILALQSEVARDIAGEIKSEVAPQQTIHRTTRPVNPEAYALYLRGRVLESRDTDEDNRAAIEALERAVALDPGFAPARAALGRVYSDRLFFFEPKDEWKEKAEAATGRALSLDPGLAEAHLSRAQLLFTPANGWQIDAAIRECQRALALDPNLAEGHFDLGGLFVHVGLTDKALQELQAASAINPALPDTAWFTGFTLLYSGRFQEALPYLSAGPRSIHALDLWQLGRKQEAWAEINELLGKDPQEKDLWLAGVHTLLMADAGETREAHQRVNEKILKQAEQLKAYGHYHHVAELVAGIYAQMHQPEEAVSWLSDAVATGLPCYPCFDHGRALDPIRQDPRFIAFMQKLKPQWDYYQAKYGSEPPLIPNPR